jgi:hypothetical protein
MNKAFRVRVEARVSGAIAEYHHARRIDHNGLVGAAREIAVRKLLDPMLPGFKTGTGTIITHDDLQSPQIDIVVYDERLISPILLDSVLGLFPLDSCFATIEVKSKLSAEELRNTIRTARWFEKARLSHLSGVTDPVTLLTQNHDLHAPVRALFAFESDLTGDVSKELQRVLKYSEPFPSSRPPIGLICIVGKGAWTFSQNNNAWFHVSADASHSEVLAFLGDMVTACQVSRQLRGEPSVSPFLFGLRSSPWRPIEESQSP